MVAGRYKREFSAQLAIQARKRERAQIEPDRMASLLREYIHNEPWEGEREVMKNYVGVAHADFRLLGPESDDFEFDRS